MRNGDWGIGELENGEWGLGTGVGNESSKKKRDLLVKIQINIKSQTGGNGE